MADTASGTLVAKGIITVSGANGKIVGVGWADSDITGIQLTHRANTVFQLNGLGNTRGAVAFDEKDMVNITFYPLPSAYTAAEYRNLDLPSMFADVAIMENTLPSGSGAAAGVILTRLVKTFIYVGDGSLGQAPGGLLMFSLPCIRFGPAWASPAA